MDGSGKAFQQPWVRHQEIAISRWIARGETLNPRNRSYRNFASRQAGFDEFLNFWQDWHGWVVDVSGLSGTLFSGTLSRLFRGYIKGVHRGIRLRVPSRGPSLYSLVQSRSKQVFLKRNSLKPKPKISIFPNRLQQFGGRGNPECQY